MALGWDIEPEQQAIADTQVFPHGVMVALHGSNRVYAFGPEKLYVARRHAWK
jgi:hypothetical protein